MLDNKKKKEEDKVEEINLDDFDINELDFPQGACNCAGCPMSCHDGIDSEEENK